MATVDDKRAAFLQKLRNKQTPGGLRADLFSPGAPTRADLAKTINKMDKTARLGMLLSTRDVAPLHGDKSQQPAGEYRMPDAAYTPPAPSPQAAPAPTGLRQTEFTNADVNQPADNQGLRGIPGRVTNPYAANFADRLKAFHANNPEFTPRSQKANKGVTIIRSLDDVRARNARVGKDEYRDMLLRQPKHRGSYSRNVLSALNDLDKTETQRRGQELDYKSALRGQDVKARNEARGQDLGYRASLRGQDITAANKAYSNDLARQRLGLDAAKYSQEQRFKSRQDKREQTAAVSARTNDVLQRLYGPDTLDGEVNTNKQRAAQFISLTNAQDPADVETAAQLYKVAEPLARASNISSSFWPALARMIPWARSNGVKLESANDVINAIEQYGRGKDVSGRLNINPADLSTIQQQRVRSLSDQLRNR